MRIVVLFISCFFYFSQASAISCQDSFRPLSVAELVLSDDFSPWPFAKLPHVQFRAAQKNLMKTLDITSEELKAMTELFEKSGLLNGDIHKLQFEKSLRHAHYPKRSQSQLLAAFWQAKYKQSPKNWFALADPVVLKMLYYTEIFFANYPRFANDEEKLVILEKVLQSREYGRPLKITTGMIRYLDQVHDHLNTVRGKTVLMFYYSHALDNFVMHFRGQQPVLIPLWIRSAVDRIKYQNLPQPSSVETQTPSVETQTVAYDIDSPYSPLTLDLQVFANERSPLRPTSPTETINRFTNLKIGTRIVKDTVESQLSVMESMIAEGERIGSLPFTASKGIEGVVNRRKYEALLSHFSQLKSEIEFTASQLNEFKDELKELENEVDKSRSAEPAGIRSEIASLKQIISNIAQKLEVEVPNRTEKFNRVLF